MQKRISFLMVTFLFLSMTTIARAQVGSVKKAIQAGVDDTEPEYIKDLMKELSNKLLIYVEDRHVNSPTERLALLFAMRAVVNVSWMLTRGYSRDVSAEIVTPVVSTAAWEAALNTASKALRDRTWRVIWRHRDRIAADAAWRVARDADWLPAKKAVTKAFGRRLRKALIVGAHSPAAGRIAYRVSEYAMLNYFLSNLDAILEPIYLAALIRLPENLTNNPFETTEAWLRFQNANFARLSTAESIHLQPWLNAVSSSMYGPLQILARNQGGENGLSWLPKELIWHILMIGAQLAQVSAAR